jgi:hypothetical protein
MGTMGPALSRFCLLTMITLLCQVTACGSSKRIAGIEPFRNPAVYELSADQVVAIMREAGFSDKEILKYGRELRNALASQGGAKIMSSRYTEAIVIVQPGYICIVRRGSREILFPLDENQAGNRQIR